MKVSGVPKFMRNRELWAHFSDFGQVLHVIRDGFADATIYFEDLTGASDAYQMREHELPGGDRLRVMMGSDPDEVERVNPDDVSL